MPAQSQSSPAPYHQALGFVSGSTPSGSVLSTLSPPQAPSQAGHLSSSPDHSPDDCPGCLADFQAALRASEASALEESRLREQRIREEEEHWRAMRASEEEEKRQRQSEEEQLRQVMEASRIDEEAAERRRLEKQREEEEHRRLLIEESRQSALREDEERIRAAHAELFERSRREAEELAERRRKEEERLQAMEAAAVEESRLEMEQEWKRRDEAERAMEEFAQRGGNQEEAAYWQQVSDDQAYNLAVEMNRTLSSGNEGASSSRVSRRPLPPTPGLAALAAGVEDASPTTDTSEEWDHPDEDSVETSDGEDPFGDQAEALPSYDEVRTDRPPEAPQVIPDHVQFAPPPAPTVSSHINTLELPSRPVGKTAAAADYTPRAQLRDLPIPAPTVGQAAASGTLLPSAMAQAKQSARLQTVPLPTPPVQIEQGLASPSTLATVAPAIVISRASTRSTIASTRSNGSARTGEQSLHNIAEATTSSSTEASSSRTLLQQRAMKGTDFGYSFEPFSPDLQLEDGETDKKHFPGTIEIKATRGDGSLRERQAYFTIRAHSWKMLLRALAWYGNTRVEAGAEEVVDASTFLKLRVEVEFVTPTKVEVIAGSTSVQEAYKNAHVAVCMSLVGSKSLKTSDAALASLLKQSSRSLDAGYLRRGSTRRVITLPSQAPILPVTVVRLAQHMHQAHIFSAACPSTSHTALHSPRDLTHAIDRHDYNYLAKLKKKRRDVDGAQGAESKAEEEGQDGNTSDDGMVDPEVVEAFGGEESGASGRMSRVKAKVMRKLAGRSGDGGAANQDLESWISECNSRFIRDESMTDSSSTSFSSLLRPAPFDLSQHG